MSAILLPSRRTGDMRRIEDARTETIVCVNALSRAGIIASYDERVCLAASQSTTTNGTACSSSRPIAGLAPLRLRRAHCCVKFLDRIECFPRGLDGFRKI